MSQQFCSVMLEDQCPCLTYPHNKFPGRWTKWRPISNCSEKNIDYKLCLFHPHSGSQCSHFSQFRSWMARVCLPDFSADMAAVTFQDMIISYEPFTNQLLFHELVHAVQYQKLGVDEFAERYVNGFLQGGGYDGIPLEINAYQLDDRFAKNPGREFSVEMEVQKWVDTGKF